MYNPSGSQLQTGSRKIQCHFVGPLAIYKCISPNQFLLMSLDGILYPVIIEEARLKPGLVATHKGPVRNMSEIEEKLHNLRLLTIIICFNVSNPRIQLYDVLTNIIHSHL